MTKRCLIILSIICLSITLSHAQVYRWVDKDGHVHFTDSQSSIPADRLEQSQELAPDPAQGQFTNSGVSSAPASTTTEAAPTFTSAEHLLWRQKETEVNARITAAQEERQHYVEQIKSTRPSHMNPAFGGRKRRSIIELGRSLAAVERQLDTLHDELQQVQAKLQSLTQTSQSAAVAGSQADSRFFDKQGHTRAYWHRRTAPLHQRIKQARAQRQAILEQLSTAPQAGGRRGKEVLQLTQELEQLNQDLNSATTKLQNLQKAAASAGAPTDWLQ